MLFRSVDILGTKGKSEETVVKMRKKVHIGMAVVMGITIFVFNLLNNTSVYSQAFAEKERPEGYGERGTAEAGDLGFGTLLYTEE